MAKARHDLRHGAQKEGCHDRRFQQGLGSVVRRKTDLQYLVWEGVGPAHHLPRNASSVPGLSILPAGHTVNSSCRTPCASTRTDSRSVVSYINHQGGLFSKRLCTLANDLLVWAQNNLRWRQRMCRAIWTMEQTCCQRTTSLQGNECARGS